MMLEKNQKRATKKEIGATLKSIYGGEGQAVDMRVHRAIRPKKKNFLIGLIIFFGLLAFMSWLGIFVFGRFGGSAADNLKLNIIGEEKPVAGREAQYEVRYKNNDEFPLASAELGIFLPKSFIMSGAEPALGEKNILKIGVLNSGDEGIILIKGKFFAIEGAEEVLQAVLTYKPANFNSNFQKVSNFTAVISGSSFDGSLNGPDKLVAGDMAAYKLTYKNKSEEMLANVAIDVIFPQNFIVSTTTPAMGKNNRWDIGKLEAGGEGSIELKGFFSSEAKGAQEIILRLGIIDNDGGFLPLIEKKAAVEVINSDLATSLIVNGADNFNAVKWGESLNYSITYKNSGAKTLYGVKFIMNISGMPNEGGKTIIDWRSLKDLNRGKIFNEDIIWTKNEISGLSQIKPGEEGTIDFSINVIAKPANPSYKDYKIDSTLSSEIEKIGNMAVRRKLQINKITAFINSDAEFTSQARYYDNDNSIVGFGPIPPKVEEKSTYRIYWKVVNSMHELNDLKVSANLPEAVVFSSPKTDAGTVALDSSLKKVVWLLNILPNSVNVITAQFDVSIIPSAANAGNIISLLEKIEFSAKDKSTGGMIIISNGDETTALPDDQFITSREKGIVQN